MPSRFRPRRIRLRDGREVKLRAIEASDAAEIVQAFDRLSADSRYMRFMQHRKALDAPSVERGVHPRPGRDFAIVATIPASDGIDIVGAAQYVAAGDDRPGVCEFSVTVAEDWRGSGLARRLMSRLVPLARRDGYAEMVGSVIAENAPMLALARGLGFEVRAVDGDASVVEVHLPLQPT
jgi:GNAT superfamily N-acetyltransferase